jgi:HKD family nuclease
MKVISSNADLNKQLKRLIKEYPQISIATAWASAETDVFKNLIKYEKRIFQAVIGTHFYQTHPDVLDRFVDSSKVKFILQPSGVFHPKVYLFWNRATWEVIVGSPNLTAGALTKNSELSVLVTSDDGQSDLKKEIADVIHGYWTKAKSITQLEADNYRRLWKLRSRDLKKIEDIFGGKPNTKPAVESKVMSMDWPKYLAEVKKDKFHGFKRRIELLEVFKENFENYCHFNDMPLDVRKGIAGLPNKTINNWGWFGSMKGAMTFGGLINKGNSALSLALDEIPRKGDVNKKQYDAYIAQYLRAFPGGRDGLATATRLLAMKRPDVFLCVDAQNKKKLAEDVGIIRTDQLDYERYWNEVVLRLMASPWWQSPEPLSPSEKAVWHARAAMLDAIFYEEKKSR